MAAQRHFDAGTVREIRREYAAALGRDRKGFPRLRHGAAARLQRRFGISHGALHALGNRQTYRDVP